MNSGLATQLGDIHARYRIFDKESFELPVALNIIHKVAGIEELQYLVKFWKSYGNSFTNVGRAPNVTSVSKSIDLPYIGENVLATGRAKYLFVFEGGTSEPTRLSCTMLACLWPLNQEHASTRYGHLFDTFWARQGRARYSYSHAKFGINHQIAKNAYAIDSVRISNGNRNPDWIINGNILRDEIALLNPDLVVLAGGKAHRAFAESKVTNRAERVPYPIWTHERAGEPEWARLRMTLNNY